jgi:hypothetical protein
MTPTSDHHDRSIPAEMRYVDHVLRIEQIRNAHNILAVNPKGRRPYRILNSRLEDNIKMKLK